MYRTIMVPLDGSTLGEYALPTALMIARRERATLHLVHVCVVSAPPQMRGLAFDKDEHSLQARSQMYLDDLAGALTERWEVPIVTSVLDGPVAPALRSYATATGAELVVMTTHGRGAVARAALGSVADELVRSLTVPLLLNRPGDEALDLLDSAHERACQRILIPLDGSTLAEAALEPAVALGALFGAEYTLLQAIDPPMLGYALTAHAAGIDPAALEVWRGEALAYLRHVAGRLRARGLRVATEVVFGHAPLAITDYTRSHEIDLVALATHGRGGVTRVLLGSVADALVRSSNAPVLVSRPMASSVRQPENDTSLEYVPM